MKRKLLVIGVILLVFLAFTCVHLWFDHPVKGDLSNLQTETEYWMNRGYTTPVHTDVQLLQTESAQNLLFVLVESGDQLGILRLEKGLMGRYKIAGSRHTDSNYCAATYMAADRTLYYVLGGRNSVFGIEKAEFSVGDTTYELTIPSGDRYLVSVPLAEEDSASGQIILPRFFTAEGEDITKQLDTNSGTATTVE